MKFRKVFTVPTQRIGRTEGHAHTITGLYSAFGRVWVSGTGVVLTSEDARLFEDISWYRNKVVSGASLTGPIEFEHPWVTPLAMRAYSPTIIRIIGYLDHQVDVFETSDGGRTWARLNAYQPSDEQENILSGAAALRKDGSGMMLVDKQSQHVLYEIDPFGCVQRIKSWETAKMGNAMCHLVLDDNDTGILVFASQNECWHPCGVEARSSIYVTENRGRDWRLDLLTEEMITALAVSDCGRVWIAGTGGLLASSMGAASWDRVSLPASAHVTAMSVTGDIVLTVGRESFFGIHRGAQLVPVSVDGPSPETEWEAVLNLGTDVLLASNTAIWRSVAM